ncbi:hypothetical protein WHR41_09276 [Cladosporium halotolerans]|uniref:Myb-like domain-containing protein n=1 Tax=Cladosporium halotolerans TaxID=1052096 RepID=A0AB34KAK8_9PEZI
MGCGRATVLSPPYAGNHVPHRWPFASPFMIKLASHLSQMSTSQDMFDYNAFGPDAYTADGNGLHGSTSENSTFDFDWEMFQPDFQQQPAIHGLVNQTPQQWHDGSASISTGAAPGPATESVEDRAQDPYAVSSVSMSSYGTQGDVEVLDPKLLDLRLVRKSPSRDTSGGINRRTPTSQRKPDWRRARHGSTSAPRTNALANQQQKHESQQRFARSDVANEWTVRGKMYKPWTSLEFSALRNVIHADRASSWYRISDRMYSDGFPARSIREYREYYEFMQSTSRRSWDFDSNERYPIADSLWRRVEEEHLKNVICSDQSEVWSRVKHEMSRKDYPERSVREYMEEFEEMRSRDEGALSDETHATAHF